MNWTYLFSLIESQGIVTDEHIECCRHIVLVCRILSSCVSKENLIVVDVLFLQFCCRVTRMYGTEVLTSNICLHGHKCECIEDYMPVQGFFLFLLNGSMECCQSNLIITSVLKYN